MKIFVHILFAFHCRLYRQFSFILGHLVYHTNTIVVIVRTTDARVQYYLYQYLLTHMNYLCLYWTGQGLNPEVGGG